jgi:hypothetical protein
MGKSIEEFKKIMESDRGEAALYASVSPIDTIKVPITREGFEALLKRSCEVMDLPVTNPLRNVLVGFLHHIENDTCTTTVEKIGAALHKAMSNQCTWEIDQEIKKAANEEMRAEQEKLRKAQEELAKQQAIEKRQAKIAKKGGKTLPVVSKDTASEKGN